MNKYYLLITIVLYDIFIESAFICRERKPLMLSFFESAPIIGISAIEIRDAFVGVENRLFLADSLEFVISITPAFPI